MELCAVALVAFKLPLRVLLGDILHVPVTGSLCQNGSGGNAGRCSVSLYHSLPRNAQGWELVAVSQSVIRLYVKPLICPFHGKHGGIQDIQLLYLLHRGGSDAERLSFVDYLVKEQLTLFLRKLLAVVETFYAHAVIKNHSRRINISRKRPSACFIKPAEYGVERSYLLVIFK